MEMIGEKIENLIVGETKRSKGRLTDCIFAVVSNGKSETNITYDYMSGRFVIHEHYRFTDDEKEVMNTRVKEYLDTLR